MSTEDREEITEELAVSHPDVAVCPAPGLLLDVCGVCDEADGQHAAVCVVEYVTAAGARWSSPSCVLGVAAEVAWWRPRARTVRVLVPAPADTAGRALVA